jgi:hypothetical protein
MGGHSKPKQIIRSSTSTNGPTPIATTGQVKIATSQPNNTATTPPTNTAVTNHKKRKPKINVTNMFNSGAKVVGKGVNMVSKIKIPSLGGGGISTTTLMIGGVLVGAVLLLKRWGKKSK